MVDCTLKRPHISGGKGGEVERGERAIVVTAGGESLGEHGGQGVVAAGGVSGSDAVFDFDHGIAEAVFDGGRIVLDIGLGHEVELDAVAEGFGERVPVAVVHGVGSRGGGGVGDRQAQRLAESRIRLDEGAHPGGLNLFKGGILAAEAFINALLRLERAAGEHGRQERDGEKPEWMHC